MAEVELAEKEKAWTIVPIAAMTRWNLFEPVQTWPSGEYGTAIEPEAAGTVLRIGGAGAPAVYLASVELRRLAERADE